MGIPPFLTIALAASQLNCVVLALRGTSGAKDVLVDLVCEAGVQQKNIVFSGKMVDFYGWCSSAPPSSV